MSSLLHFKHLHPLRIAKDNSLYRAIAIALYKDEDLYLLLRRTVTESMLESGDYTGFLQKSIQRNLHSGFWTPELSFLVPLAITQILPVRIEVYTGGIHDPMRVYGSSTHQKIRLLETNGHYDLLAKK